MSRLHRVIILNKPLKIRGFTVIQWISLGLSVALGLWASTSLVPKEWKVANAPAGVFVFVGIVGGIVALISALEMKPLVWWTNQAAYRLKLKPVTFLPHTEQPSAVYPDPTIIELRKEDEFYTK